MKKKKKKRKETAVCTTSLHIYFVLAPPFITGLEMFLILYWVEGVKVTTQAG